MLPTALHLKERNFPEKVTLLQDQNLLDELDPELREAVETLLIYQNKKNLEIFLNEIQPGRLIANKNLLRSNWREKGYFLSQEPFHDSEALLQRTLIIVSKQDSICGYQEHFSLLEKLPNKTFAIIDQAGHMLQIEKREIVQELMKEWLIRTNLAHFAH